MLRLPLLLVLGAPAFVGAQPALSTGAALDTVLTWESYDAPRRVRVRTYIAADPRRPLTVVIDEAASGGPTVAEDARYVAEQCARRLRFDATAATFVFRFTAASFVAGSADGGRTLLLRASFRPSGSGGLGPPAWRVITPAALEELTSRQLR